MPHLIIEGFLLVSLTQNVYSAPSGTFLLLLSQLHVTSDQEESWLAWRNDQTLPHVTLTSAHHN